MIAATQTAVAYSVAAYLASADIVDSSVAPTFRSSTRVEEVHAGSYIGRPFWGFRGASQVGNARPDDAIFLGGADRPEDALVASVVEFLDLESGWDGENALPPDANAVVDAIRFIHAVGGFAMQLEPTLHVDGSVILELGDGSAGSLRFKGDGNVVYALEGSAPGTLPFTGYTVPDAIGAALRA